MEYECSPLSWEFCYQEEGLEELRHSLLYTTLELEATIASAKEEITTRECELIHVNDLFSMAIKERDEAQAKCQKLMLEKLELQQELQHQQQLVQIQTNQQQQHQRHHNTPSQNEDHEFQQGAGTSEKQYPSPASSSDCDEENNSIPSPHPTTPLEVALELAQKKPLPEKGKLLKAVVEAGPLLQTILLAGPLPQWQHPPPQLNSIEIPPVTISSPTAASSLLSKKRDLVLSEGGVVVADCPLSKCRKVIDQNLPTPTTATASHHHHHSLPHQPSFS